MSLEIGPAAVPADKPNDDDESRKSPKITHDHPARTSQAPRQTLKLDAEYAEWKRPLGDKVRVPPCDTPLAFRQFNESFVRAAWRLLPPQPGIVRAGYTCASYDGAPIDIERFATAAQTAGGSRRPKQPAVVYLHGGGMVAMSVDIFAPRLAQMAAESGVQIFAVEYRLAPEHAHPTPVEDCYAGLAWLSAHAAELGVDPARLGLMGDSAGGGLAAGAALMARERGLDPPVKKQILAYPMLDDRSIAALAAAGSPLIDFATIPLPILLMCWEAYVGKEKAGRNDADVSPYAAPGRAGDLRGLPSTYIDVGGLDLFRDECASFAARLAAADVEVEFHMFPGVPHAFEAARHIGITKRAAEGRVRWMRDL
ncbi:hypothetical protein AAE478_010032 [Parahypoxylon ruwenzoriense]